MESKRPTCVITLYNEETETISHYQVAQSSISSVIEKRASFDVPLADFGNKIDDDFARKLGSMILLLLAARNPSLKDQLFPNDAPPTLHRRRSKFRHSARYKTDWQ